VAITFDNFYKVLDQSKVKNQLTLLDYEVIEMQKMEPLMPPQTQAKLQESKNVIYIENDDLLEGNSSDTAEAQELGKPRDPRKSQVSNMSSVMSMIESPNASGLVLGDTGDHHFPRSNLPPDYTDPQQA
jgi:hypothetical protein